MYVVLSNIFHNGSHFFCIRSPAIQHFVHILIVCCETNVIFNVAIRLRRSIVELDIRTLKWLCSIDSLKMPYNLYLEAIRGYNSTKTIFFCNWTYFFNICIRILELLFSWVENRSFRNTSWHRAIIRPIRLLRRSRGTTWGRRSWRKWWWRRCTRWRRFWLGSTENKTKMLW